MSTTTTPSASRIVPVLGSKGGTGRTTTVVHLAAALARQGRRVAVMDTTALGDCTEWIQDAQTDSTDGEELSFELLETTGQALPATNAEIVLVDTDGNGPAYARIRPILDAATLALIPLQPSPIDVNSLWATLDILDTQHPHLPTLALLTRANPATTLYRETRAVLAKESTSALAASIPDWVEFTDSVGTVPAASAPWDAAAAELLRRLFPTAPAREPMRPSSFALPQSTRERLLWARYTTGTPMNRLVADAVDAAYPAPPAMESPSS